MATSTLKYSDVLTHPTLTTYYENFTSNETTITQRGKVVELYLRFRNTNGINTGGTWTTLYTMGSAPTANLTLNLPIQNDFAYIRITSNGNVLINTSTNVVNWVNTVVTFIAKD